MTSRLARNLVAIVAATVATAVPKNAEGQEVSLLAGSISSRSDWPNSYAWSFSYRDLWSWNPHFSTTVAYLNQGHFPGHHRDGVTAQAWAQTDLLGEQLTLAVGAGPFRYYDTTVASNGGGYSDNHGWAWIYSVDLTWQPRKHGWFAELRFDQTSPAKSIETTSVTLGGGYRFSEDLSHSATGGVDSYFDETEATVFYGKTVVNNFHSPESVAKAVEFRQRFGDRVRATAAFINEGDPQLIRRSGFVGEGWLEPSFSSDRYSVGVGVGYYAAIDKYRPSAGRHLSAIVSLTLSCRIVDHLDARFNWHRIVTDYDRDTDIVLYGVGYRF